MRRPVRVLHASRSVHAARPRFFFFYFFPPPSFRTDPPSSSSSWLLFAPRREYPRKHGWSRIHTTRRCSIHESNIPSSPFPFFRTLYPARPPIICRLDRPLKSPRDCWYVFPMQMWTYLLCFFWIFTPLRAIFPSFRPFSRTRRFALQRSSFAGKRVTMDFAINFQITDPEAFRSFLIRIFSWSFYTFLRFFGRTYLPCNFLRSGSSF